MLKAVARGSAAPVHSDIPLFARFTGVVADPPHGSYLAVLDRSPFWDPGITGVDERGSFHLVLGWPEARP